jgi:SAM-dependent methyltransferase
MLASFEMKPAMERLYAPEILDESDLPEPVLHTIHNDLSRIHHYLGDTAALVRALRRDPLPIGSVLDIGCGYGGVLREVQRKLGVRAVGVDLRPPPANGLPFPILRADAVRDPLPQCDVAVSLHTAHHLEERELIELIRNAGKSCRRFVLIDLVRHPLPLALFRTFVAPLISRINAEDGCTSVRRAYTPEEMRAVAELALCRGKNGTFTHSVAPLYIRQMLDITYR